MLEELIQNKLIIFVTIMAVPGLSRFIDYSGHSFQAHPIPHQYISHLYPLEPSIQLTDISPPYIPAYPQQVTHVYTPPENTYRGFTYQTLDIYGGISQVGFMTGSEANSLLEDSFKALGTVKILVPKLNLNKTPDSKENLSRKTENKLHPEDETKSTLPEQSVAAPVTQDKPISSSGYFFPPIQVNHFQAGASYITPPFFNGQPNFSQQFGFNSMAEIPDTTKATEEVAATNDNGLPMSNDNEVPMSDKGKPDLSESTEQSRSIENILTKNTSTSPSTEAQNATNESSVVKDNNNSSSSDNISNEESSTILPTDKESTAKDENSSATDEPQSSTEIKNISNQSSITSEDESTSSNTSETTPNPSDSSLEENTTTETSE